MSHIRKCAHIKWTVLNLKEINLSTQDYQKSFALRCSIWQAGCAFLEDCRVCMRTIPVTEQLLNFLMFNVFNESTVNLRWPVFVSGDRWGVSSCAVCLVTIPTAVPSGGAYRYVSTLKFKEKGFTCILLWAEKLVVSQYLSGKWERHDLAPKTFGEGVEPNLSGSSCNETHSR